MTDKVRIDTLVANSLNGNNETYLARQAEFESNVRVIRANCRWQLRKPRAFGSLMLRIINILIAWPGRERWLLDIITPTSCKASKMSLPAACRYILDLTTPLKDRFSDYLLSVAGRRQSVLPAVLRPVRCRCGGSRAEAGEKHTGRSGVISFSGGYHGMTHGALSVTGNLSPKAAINGMMPEVQFMPYPHEYRCPLGIGGEAGVKALTYYFDNLINDVESGVRKPAAVILEAVQGEGGVNPAPAEWLQRIRKVTQEHGILLIIDEVQAGFARTGKLFAFEHAGIEPDIIVMSKAVGGGLPLAVLGIKKEFDAWEPGHHTGTFRGNQLAMATGLTTLQYLKEHKVADKVAAQGEWLKGKLAELQKRYPVIGHVRGLGLMIGIEIVKPNEAQDHMGCYPADGELSALLQKKCFESGLILERGGRNGCVLRLLPSLLITNDELGIFLDKFEQALLAAGVKPV